MDRCVVDSRVKTPVVQPVGRGPRLRRFRAEGCACSGTFHARLPGTAAAPPFRESALTASAQAQSAERPDSTAGQPQMQATLARRREPLGALQESTAPPKREAPALLLGPGLEFAPGLAPGLAFALARSFEPGLGALEPACAATGLLYPLFARFW